MTCFGHACVKMHNGRLFRTTALLVDFVMWLIVELGLTIVIAVAYIITAEPPARSCHG
jgi:hypothetical protein